MLTEPRQVNARCSLREREGGHSRLRRLLLALEVPRMAMNLIEALPLGILEGYGRSC